MSDREKALRATASAPDSDVAFLLGCLNDERARMVALEEDLVQAIGVTGHAHANAVVCGIREAFRLAHVED